jgi:hypothetical protein
VRERGREKFMFVFILCGCVILNNGRKLSLSRHTFKT